MARLGDVSRILLHHRQIVHVRGIIAARLEHDHVVTIYDDLAEDLGLEKTTIKRAVYFFEAYKESVPRHTFLTWSHYQHLVGLRRDPERKFYENLAVEEAWTRDRLRDAIRRDEYAETGTWRITRAGVENMTPFGE